MDTLIELDNMTGGNLFVLVLAAFVILLILRGVRIVPQSEKYVVERFGRLRTVLGPGINLIVPIIDSVAHKISILELVPGEDIQKKSHKEKHGMRLRSLLYVISKTY